MEEICSNIETCRSACFDLISNNPDIEKDTKMIKKIKHGQEIVLKEQTNKLIQKLVEKHEVHLISLSIVLNIPILQKLQTNGIVLDSKAIILLEQLLECFETISKFSMEIFGSYTVIEIETALCARNYGYPQMLDAMIENYNNVVLRKM